MVHSILLLCPDVVTERMAGPAIRYWEFAKALAPFHNVTLAIPNTVEATCQPPPHVRLLQHTSENIAELVAQHDIILFQGYIFDKYPLLQHTPKILIADLYDPIPLEGLAQHQETQLLANQVRMMNDQLKSADYFLCASDRQRDLWLGHLLALGRINALTYRQMQQRVVTVPFGLPNEPPLKTGPGFRQHAEDFTLLWGGGIWEWFDPLTIIHAVHHLLPRCPELKLIFLGTQHPNPSIETMPMQHRAETLARELKLHGNQVVFQAGWVPYNVLHNYLLEADVGVSAHFNTLETHFSFRTRILYYLWAGKPIITTAGDVLAEAITDSKAGIIVAEADQNAWVEAILGLRDAKFYSECAAGAHMLSQRYRWSMVTQPLQSLCRQASVAPDRAIIGEHRESRVWDCERDFAALKHYIDVVESSNSWRLTAPLRAVRRWFGR